MLEDKLLIWKLHRGNNEALERIYEKYKIDLLRLATLLLVDNSVAEDVVHEVFASFIRTSAEFRLKGSLKSYLAICVANRARNVNRDKYLKQSISLDDIGNITSQSMGPDRWLILDETLQQAIKAMAQLPYEQREVIVLHLYGDLVFRKIAKKQNVSIKTVQSRYRLGLEKLRSIINSELK